MGQEIFDYRWFAEKLRKTKRNFTLRIRSGILSNYAAHNNTTLLPIPWGRVLLEKLIFVQLAKKLHLFFRTTGCITALIEFRQYYCNIYRPIKDLVLLHRE
jgi:hypothetical protein